jgi:hypothetical protein
MLDDWYNYFHQCSQCRRCSVFCPYGIDTASADGVMSKISAPFWSNGYLTATPVSSSISSSRSSKVSRKAGSGNPKLRQDLFRSVYRRHFTFAGKYFPKLVGAKELDDEMLDDWYNT